MPQITINCPALKHAMEPMPVYLAGENRPLSLSLIPGSNEFGKNMQIPCWDFGKPCCKSLVF